MLHCVSRDSELSNDVTLRDRKRHQHSLRLCLLALEALRLSPWPMELRKTTASTTSPKCIVPAAQSRWVPPAGRQITAEGAPFTLWQVERSRLQPAATPLAGGLCRCKSVHVRRTNHSTQEDEDENDEVLGVESRARWEMRSCGQRELPFNPWSQGQNREEREARGSRSQEILTWVSNPAQEHVSY